MSIFTSMTTTRPRSAAKCRSALAAAVLLLGGLWVPGGVQAQEAFTAEVAVADRSPSEQEAAYRLALQTVLVNNAADKTLLSRNDVRKALAAAKTFVVQFSYRAPQPGSVIGAETPVTDRVRNTGEATQILKVRFDRDRVREVIEGQKNDTAAAGTVAKFRSILVWFAIRDGDKDLLIGGANGAKVMQRAREIAGGNGIVLFFPAADAADRQALGGETLNLSQQAVLGASLRYASPAILSAAITRKQPVGWQGNWQRFVDDQVDSATFEADTLDELLRLGLMWMAPQQASNALAAQLAQPAAPLASESTIWVSGVRSTAQYAAVMKSVSTVPGVSSAYAKELRNEGLIIAVQPRSALGSVRARLAQTNGLRETAAPVFADGSSPRADAAFTVVR